MLGDGGQTVATSAGLEQPLALDFQSLRSICAKSLRERRTEFEAFVVEADVSNSSADDADSFEAYCREIENTAAWGGHVEIQALSKALKIHIRIFRTGSSVISVGEQYAGENTTLNICYLQHAFGLGEHYNSTRPIAVS
jgi:OTU domain-containing protein 6